MYEWLKRNAFTIKFLAALTIVCFLIACLQSGVIQ